MIIHEITEECFKKYGKVIDSIDLTELVSTMQTVEIPADVVYEPSISALEKLKCATELQQKTYGELPIQIGWCIGNNHKLNAVEYHRCSEVNIAATDAILILGRQQDISVENTYDTSLMEAFRIPSGTAVELYATTLHYAPCNASAGGFLVAVVLPKGIDRRSESVGVTASTSFYKRLCVCEFFSTDLSKKLVSVKQNSFHFSSPFSKAIW